MMRPASVGADPVTSVTARDCDAAALKAAGGRGVVAVPLVVPTPRQLRAPAVWVTIANWADGLAHRYGDAIIHTPDGPLARAAARGVGGQVRVDAPLARTRSAAQMVARTLASDLRRAWWAGRYGLFDMPRVAGRPPFVWQHHDLFQLAGFRLARRHDVPLVLFVDAPQVWEARTWGVRRPGWEGLLEALGDVPPLRRADVVACVSAEVRAAVCALGVDPSRTVVTPCTAPTQLPNVDGGAVRTDLGLGDAFVVGWVGSFRRFHGLDVLVAALQTLTHEERPIALLAVGDGAERASIERACADHGVRAVFTGSVAHGAVFEYMAAFDCGVVTAAPGGSFHYSPLKLKEYLAAGVPVVAPDIGEMARALEHDTTALLYEPAGAVALGAQIARLASTPDLGERLANNGRVLNDTRFSIARQIEDVEKVLAERSRR